MRKTLLTFACAAVAISGVTSAAYAQPKGNGHGYWAGRICDATTSWTGYTGVPYWEFQGYMSRGHCVSAHVEWLKAGNEVPYWA